MKTDTSEKGLERLICTAMTGSRAIEAASSALRETRRHTVAGLDRGSPDDYDREYARRPGAARGLPRGDAARGTAEALDFDDDSPTRRQFLARLQGEITKRGVDRRAPQWHQARPARLDLFYGTPSPGNTKAAERYAANRFSVTRQLRYSRDETQLRSTCACSSTACRSPRSS